MATNKEMLQEILDRIEALEPIIEELVEAKKTLDARREQNRKHKAEIRANVSRQKTECQLTCQQTKEERAEIKEISPHTPYIENKGEKEENSCSSSGSRNARATLSPLATQPDELVVSEAVKAVRQKDAEEQSAFVRTIPTLKTVLSHNKNRINPSIDEKIVREWFAICEASDWIAGDGTPIYCWPRHLMNFANYYDKNKAEQDPNRVPDANKPKRIQIEHINQDRKACNWRGTRKENIGHALG